MAYKYIIAILPPEVAPALEAQLTRIGVGGITLSRVKGFGEYKNFFSRDWLTAHTKAELFVEAAHVDAVLDALREITNAAAPGVVAVASLEHFGHLHAGADTGAEPAQQGLNP